MKKENVLFLKAPPNFNELDISYYWTKINNFWFFGKFRFQRSQKTTCCSITLKSGSYHPPTYIHVSPVKQLYFINFHIWEYGPLSKILVLWESDQTSMSSIFLIIDQNSIIFGFSDSPGLVLCACKFSNETEQYFFIFTLHEHKCLLRRSIILLLLLPLRKWTFK